MSNQNIKILISGEGGQGVQTIAKILAEASYKQKYEVCYMPHYGVEMRMGISLAYLQIGMKSISYPKFDVADILVCMTPRDMKFTKSFLDKNTETINGMNLREYMKENAISEKSLNMLILGILVKKLKERLSLETEKIREEIKNKLDNKAGLVENIDAFTKGINLEEKYYYLGLDKYPRKKLKPKTIRNHDRIYTHFPSHCKACGLCIEICPTKALSWSKNDLNYFDHIVPVVDIEKCIACGICENLCPDLAIRILKK